MTLLKASALLPITWFLLCSTSLAAATSSPTTIVDSPKLPVAPKSTQQTKDKVDQAAKKRLSAPKLIFGVEAKKLEKVIRGTKVGYGIVLRGAKEQEIYAKYSGSVVLVVTKDGLGSGSIISDDGLVLTNWHVVGAEKQVAILFKPGREGDRPNAKNAVLGTVLKVDEVADLALIKLSAVPADVTPIQLATANALQVGADVHAIGHPIGETWSYTKGLVSQIRRDYSWKTERSAHKADVIQTQTPISPGSSGGPLLDDDGKIVGVNAFKASDGDGLNFAIAVSDVKKFVAAKNSRVAANGSPKAKSEADCEISILGQGKTPKGASYVSYDLDCDRKQDVVQLTPQDQSKPILLLFDLDHNRVAERTYFDHDRDGNLDYVTYDTNQDGKADLVGTDLDASLQPKAVRSLG